MEDEKLQQQFIDVGQRIRTLREIIGISESEMARRTGVSEADYLAYESGRLDFSFTFIYKCAKCFDVDPTDLIRGTSPTLSTFTVTKCGDGLPITRRHGFSYLNLAPMFKNKIAEPFRVSMPYSEAEQDAPIHLSNHTGQEFDIVIRGSMRVQIGDHVQTLNEGDTIYYNSGIPHGMIATSPEGCEIYAVVLNAEQELSYDEDYAFDHIVKAKLQEQRAGHIYEKYAEMTVDESGVLQSVEFHNEETFNFAFDCVDALARKSPDKLAMLHVSRDKKETRFTFRDMMRYSNQTANYLQSLGIRKGDRVMLVLKRHYQFWFAMLALHKIGAVAIPATNLLVEHDFTYRFDAAGVKAILCTADGDVAHQVDLAAAQCPLLELKVLVGGARDGWHDFNEEFGAHSDSFARTADSACGSDPLLMLFTSGTTGYPRIAAHCHKYPLGHIITAKYWHKVSPGGLHFTISDTGWGKALWGKLYGQWLCESAIFVYDFDRFHAEDILPMFHQYNITTFCAPPTMYRFFIKEDLSRYDLSSIEHSTVAGEALNPEVFEQWKKATGLKLMEGFGQTETTLSIANLVGMEPKPGSMGKPSPLYHVSIVNPDGSECAVGETGEIVIHTKDGAPCGLFIGYYNDDAHTNAAWYDDCYHTGDTAWRDEDGYFWYVGRTDDLIKSSGYRIGPFEIESVIMELPYVLECAVTPVPDPIRGQVVKATIVLVKGKEGTEELKKEVQTYVKEHTAPYKYPRIVEFRDDLPKTISGKIRRVELKNESNQS